MSEAEAIVRLSECDTEVLRLNRQLSELPEAAEIMKCRAKRKELKGKQDEVFELTDDVNSKITKLQTEEERVIAKINELQSKLDSTKDYRETTSFTRDMEGQVKRQIAIGEEQDELLERQIKVDQLAAQLHEMLHAVDHHEEELSATFREKGGALKEAAQARTAEREKLAAEIDDTLLKRYEKMRAEKGGIGLGLLEGERCTACSATFLEGQLSKLRKGPAITECPNCHRIMVVRSKEA